MINKTEAKNKINDYFTYEDKVEAAKALDRKKAAEPSKPFTICVGVGIALLICLVIGLCSGSEVFAIISGIGLSICLVVGIVFLVKDTAAAKMRQSSANNIPHPCSDRVIDNFFNEYISNEEMLNKAISKLSLDISQVNVIDPIYLSGYYFNSIQGLNPKLKKGSDGRYRSSAYENTVLLFSENQIYMYSYRYNILTNSTSEKADEYFYQDIVTATTDSKEIKVFDREDSPKFSTEYFSLTTTGGTSLTCSIVSSSEETQHSIIAMKHLIRDKKLEK